MSKSEKEDAKNMNDMEFMGYFVGCNLQQLAKAHSVYFTYAHFL